MNKKKFMVTSALPYANGPIHLGHIAGAYLPADIFVRFNRLVGNDVLFICGTDEHGVPITLRAEQENVTPRVIVKRYHEDIKKAFDRMNIIFDNFSGTSNIHNKHHATISREFFSNLSHNELISTHLSDQFYCKHCDRFLPDRFIQGICPLCGYKDARGDECPECRGQFETLEIKNPRCKICSNVPDVKPTKHWYLRLDLLQKELEDWLNGKTYWKENVLNFVKGWLKQGLKERAITRDLYWGVPVPLEEAAGKVLYVWFDAPIGYISSTMEWAENQGDIKKWKEYWQNPECKIVHFIGKDNIPFHAIIWPAMMLGQRQNYELPWQIPANEYLNFGVKGDEATEKASKSAGNVVWVHEALDVFSTDMIRYHLAACAPEKSDTIFTWKDFQQKCNGELLGIIGNFANRVLKFIENNFEGKVPKSTTLEAREKQFMETISDTVKKVRGYYENFEVRNAVAEIVALSRLGNQYFDEKAPWTSIKENKEDCQNAIFVSSQLVNALAVILSPVIPDSADNLWRQLGHKQKIAKWEEATKKLTSGHVIGKPKGLFVKIEDDVIKPLEEKLAKAIKPEKQTAEKGQAKDPKDDKAKNEKPKDDKTKKTDAVSKEEKPKSEETPLKKATITMETFEKMEIRIGEILEAKKVAKSDKLLQIMIKIGEETKQIVSGIAQYYEPESLKGKKVPVIVNLEPAKIRGVESQGMILCADVDDKAVLLHPDKDVPPGSIVR